MLGNKYIGIIGGEGYIGSSLHSTLKKKYCYNKNCKVDLIPIDVSRRHEFKHFNFKKYDVIYHLAAKEVRKNQSVLEIFKERSVNSDSLLFLSEVVSSNTKLIFTSSTNINEKHISTWSSHKLLSENYIKCLFKNWAILRLPNIYGIFNQPKTPSSIRPVINKVIFNALKNNTLNLYKNKNCLRDFTHIEDIVEALILATDLSKNKLYSIGSKDSKSIEETWNIISKELKIDIKPIDIELSEMEMRSYTCDYKNFTKDTGWAPKIDIHTGILNTINSLKTYEN